MVWVTAKTSTMEMILLPIKKAKARIVQLESTLTTQKRTNLNMLPILRSLLELHLKNQEVLKWDKIAM